MRPTLTNSSFIALGNHDAPQLCTCDSVTDPPSNLGPKKLIAAKSEDCPCTDVTVSNGCDGAAIQHSGLAHADRHHLDHGAGRDGDGQSHVEHEGD